MSLIADKMAGLIGLNCFVNIQGWPVGVSGQKKSNFFLKFFIYLKKIFVTRKSFPFSLLYINTRFEITSFYLQALISWSNITLKSTLVHRKCYSNNETWLDIYSHFNKAQLPMSIVSWNQCLLFFRSQCPLGKPMSIMSIMS